MTVEEKREALLKYCHTIACEECVLNQKVYSKEYGAVYRNDCLTIADAPEEDLDKGLELINSIGKDTDEDTFEDVVEDTTEDTTEDVINHPSHYTHGGMECIDEMILVFGKDTVKKFCLCNAWKYRKRAMYKNGEEDMRKSDWYIAKYKELSTYEYKHELESF